VDSHNSTSQNARKVPWCSVPPRSVLVQLQVQYKWAESYTLTCVLAGILILISNRWCDAWLGPSNKGAPKCAHKAAPQDGSWRSVAGPLSIIHHPCTCAAGEESRVLLSHSKSAAVSRFQTSHPVSQSPSLPHGPHLAFLFTPPPPPPPPGKNDRSKSVQVRHATQLVWAAPSCL
jgi:hypothetical protein